MKYIIVACCISMPLNLSSMEQKKSFKAALATTTQSKEVDKADRTIMQQLKASERVKEQTLQQEQPKEVDPSFLKYLVWQDEHGAYIPESDDET